MVLQTEVLQELPAGSQQPQAGDIDWGDLSSDIQSDGIENQSDGIDWDNPGILELGDIVVLEDSAVEKGGEGGRQEEGVASLKQQSKSCADSAGDLETLLSSPVTRALFLDDIMELKEFISWRLRELTRTDDILSGQVSTNVDYNIAVSRAMKSGSFFNSECLWCNQHVMRCASPYGIGSLSKNACRSPQALYTS